MESMFIIDEKSEKIKEQLRSKMEDYLQRAEKIKRHISQTGSASPLAYFLLSIFSRSNLPTSTPLSNASDTPDKLKGILQNAILKENPNVKWGDVIGLECAKEALKEAVILPMKFPQLFAGKRKPWRGILLYGVSMCEITNSPRGLASRSWPRLLRRKAMRLLFLSRRLIYYPNGWAKVKSIS